MNKTLQSTQIVLFTLAFAACASKSTTSTSSGSGSDAVDQGSDAVGAESDTESLSTSLVGGDSNTLSLASAGDLTAREGELTLDGLGDGAKKFYQPAGCLVVTADATAKTAKYAFSDCTGPYGLVHITGEIDITWTSAAANQLTVNYSATALKINGATIDWSATANITGSGLARDLVWDGKFNGTTRHGG